MKKILTSASLLLMFAGAANAQHAFNATEFKNNLGKPAPFAILFTL
ncbi:hypothetical protein [Mucilaginibacter sp. SG564]|nr:hypothetical protein [Mucilaginibacter sp. SG564]NOW94391.1 hypothetical protein [Mucilaginibacter sp. SG564]